MKTFLFITGLAFNVFLCTFPFGQTEPNFKPGDRALKSDWNAPVKSEDPGGFLYSDMLKNKATQIKKH